MTPDRGLEIDAVQLSDLGTARRVIITGDDPTFVEGGGAVEARMNQIRVELERATVDNDIEAFKERLARLCASGPLGAC